MHKNQKELQPYMSDIAGIIGEAKTKLEALTGGKFKYKLYFQADSVKNHSTIRSIEELTNNILATIGKPQSWVLSKSKADNRPAVRQLICYAVLLKVPKATLKEITPFIGVKNHTSVINSNRQAKNHIDTKDACFMHYYNQVKHLLNDI